MVQEKSWFKRYAKIGPGGWKCPCCGPAPGKFKKRERRRWLQNADRQVEREIRVELNQK